MRILDLEYVQFLEAAMLALLGDRTEDEFTGPLGETYSAHKIITRILENQ